MNLRDTQAFINNQYEYFLGRMKKGKGDGCGLTASLCVAEMYSAQ